MSNGDGSDQELTGKAQATVPTLYANSAEGLKAVQGWYEYWTGNLTDISFQLSFAVIACNWAVFGAVNKIIDNRFSKLSIAAVLLCLALSLIGTHFLGTMLRDRVRFAEANPSEWEREFTASQGNESPWPSTKSIDNVAKVLRWSKAWLPFSGGILFILALWCP